MEQYTQIPNFILDEWMKNMSPSAFKVLMVICRKTLGWQKESDNISQSQIIGMTGMSKHTVIKALEELKYKELINTIEKPGITTNYTLNCTGAEIAPVQKLHLSSAETAPDKYKTSAETAHTKENIKKLNKRNRILPSSLQEIKDYAISQNITNVDIDFFYNYFNANNWCDKDNKPVNNYKLKLHTWNHYNKKHTKSNYNNAQLLDEIYGKDE